MERASGTAYLALVTDLLQRARLADPVAGLWEAADLQWWFTRDPHPADEDAAFWPDAAGTPTTAVVFTRWGPDRYGCDVLGTPTPAAWDFVAARSAELAHAGIEMAVAPGTEDAATRAGFTERSETYDICWLDAADRPARGDLPAGYALVPRPDQSGPHPMVTRNGAEVEARLRQCSLYDPGLDLAVRAPDGTTAAYALFWPDLRTGVGLVEPMRVEDRHAGRGVAGALLRAGLDGLAARGCTRFKVSHDPANTAARRLYLGAGFRPQSRAPVRTRPATRA
ncbi:MAG TPA: GNAT family N-acetyltransferase [Mycobacteriales bacterium]